LESLKYVHILDVTSQNLYLTRHSSDMCFTDIIMTKTVKIISQQQIFIPKELKNFSYFHSKCLKDSEQTK